jgi:chromatin remodeling complex protein RSC6
MNFTRVLFFLKKTTLGEALHSEVKIKAVRIPKVPKEPKVAVPKVEKILKEKKTVNAPNYAVSAAFGKIIGTEDISRAQAIKKFWEYAKSNNLQVLLQ